MKRWVIVFGILVVSTAKSQTTNFYTNVTNLWVQGHKSNVLEIVEQRLNTNTNDMPGLLIKLAYQEEFLLLDSISNTVNKIIFVGGTITNQNFKTHYSSFKENQEFMLDFLTTYHPTPTELIQERAKGLIPQKPFIYYKYLEALQKDGLCD